MKKKILIVLIIVCIAMLSAFAMIACDTDENTVEMDGFKFKLLRDGSNYSVDMRRNKGNGHRRLCVWRTLENNEYNVAGRDNKHRVRSIR